MTRKAVVIIVLSLVALLCSNRVSKAQEQTLKVDVNLVLVNATVADMNGCFVAGLDRGDFWLTEDGVAQKIEYFSVEDLPLSVGLIFDATGSMAGKLSSAR